MQTTIGGILTLTAALTLGTGAAPAQQTHEHRGFWIGFGLGAGANLSDGLDGTSLGGGGGYIRLGGTPNQRVLLGFEAIGWARERDGKTLGRGNSAFTAMFYPRQQGGAFVKGGIGWATISRTTTSGSTVTSTSEDGFALTLGTGWDVRIGRNLYLTPNLDFLVQVFESQDDPVLGHIPGTNTILLFTLGLTWH